MALLTRTIAGLVCAAGLLAGALNAPADVAREYDLKAAFLFNFSQFIEWPTNAFASADSPFTIGVLGDDPFGAALDNLIRNETACGRPLVVRRYRSVSDIADCQILFISKSENAKLETILTALKGRNILTVGETDESAAGGGIVRLLTDRNKIRIRINADAAKAEKLTISSKLLRLAEIVGHPPDRK